MPLGGKTATTLLLTGLVLGMLLAHRHVTFSTVRKPAAFSAEPAAPARRVVSSWLKVRQLTIENADGSARLWIGESSEGSPSIWMTNARRTTTIEAGVHGDGFPYVLVSDRAIRNFGLGRIDGAQASPILVFRSDDVVRMVFGLDMVDKQQSPFLVRYTVDGEKQNVIGHYCDRPDRICAR